MPCYAKIKINKFGNVTYIENATIQELEEVFKKHKYKRFRALDNDSYPAIFVKNLPIDYETVSSQKYRNELFIRILAPLALKINEEISNERKTLLRIEEQFKKTQTLTEQQIEKLNFFAKKYDYHTKEKDLTNKIVLQINHLKRRIHTVPPSILIAAAAMESNWGTSRPARLVNNLYKEKLWFTTEGLEPIENKEDGYRFKIFDSLIDSMRSFALTFNSNINFEPVWTARYDMDKRIGAILGENIAYTLSNASNLPNFVGILDYTTAFYDLFAIDIGNLKREE
jgi:Bax protein